MYIVYTKKNPTPNLIKHNQNHFYWLIKLRVHTLSTIFIEFEQNSTKRNEIGEIFLFLKMFVEGMAHVLHASNVRQSISRTSFIHAIIHVLAHTFITF